MTLLACLVGVLIPQTAYFNSQFFLNWQHESPLTFWVVDVFGFNRVFSTIWFLVLVLILILLLGYTLLRQSKALLKKRKRNRRKWGSFLFHLGLFTISCASIYTLRIPPIRLTDLA